jgi:glycogen debranching enzyme
MLSTITQLLIPRGFWSILRHVVCVPVCVLGSLLVPQAGYNLYHSPHLVPAHELDNCLVSFSEDLAEGRIQPLSPSLWTDEDVQRVLVAASERMWALRLWEYYQIDEQVAIEAALGVAQSSASERVPQEASSDDLFVCSGRRFAASPNGFALASALELGKARFTETNEQMEARLRGLVREWNVRVRTRTEEDLRAALRSMSSHLRYERLERRLGPVTASSPLVPRYFATLGPSADGLFTFAHNGWVWDGNPYIDYAGVHSRAYLRREVCEDVMMVILMTRVLMRCFQVMPWTDSIKLRYGQGPNDSPWLWRHMREYTERLASIFHAFRCGE